MRVVIAVGGIIIATTIALLVWAASSGALECKENEHSEIVSHITTTQMVGKVPITQTTPIYGCIKNKEAK